MNLLNLACQRQARVTAIKTSSPEEQRLHAIGIYIGSVVTKLQDSPIPDGQPVCVATDERSIFAISRKLAAAIKITPLE